MVIFIRENLHKEGTFNSRIIIPYKKKEKGEELSLSLSFIYALGC